MTMMKNILLKQAKSVFIENVLWDDFRFVTRDEMYWYFKQFILTCYFSPSVFVISWNVCTMCVWISVQIFYVTTECHRSEEGCLGWMSVTWKVLSKNCSHFVSNSVFTNYVKQLYLWWNCYQIFLLNKL